MRSENAAELKRLRDAVSSALLALKNLKRPTDQWDDILVFIIQQKFSPRTKLEWNLYNGSSNDYPSYRQVNTFMTQRIRGIEKPFRAESSGGDTVADRPYKARVSVHLTSDAKCTMCGGAHRLFRCSAFRRAALETRYQHAKQHRCCFNCLQVGHFPKTCPSASRCQKCQQPHHSLLHRNREADVQVADVSRATVSDVDSETRAPRAADVLTASNTLIPRENTFVLLATAQVALRTLEGQTIKVRALLDQGSTFSFISETLAQNLCTQRTRAHVEINGFGGQYAGVARSKIQAYVLPSSGEKPMIAVCAFVFQSITAYAASRTARVDAWPHLQGLELADPATSDRQPIHFLIGADLYGSILRDGLRKGPTGSPTAQATIFGWVLSGPVSGSPRAPPTATALHALNDEAPLDKQLREFWEIEELPKQTHLTPDELQCEEHFRLTHSRDSAGRYIVRLPFRVEPTNALGESRDIAVRLYTRLEQRLRRAATLETDYNAFLSEYESLGHMEAVTSNPATRGKIVYLPHHAVVKQTSATTKLRVVFNASQPTSNGTSLNHILRPGPKLQLDLTAIVMRWRLYRFVYTADIEKMFRQIRIHPSDTDYQRILWRQTPTSEIRDYRLTTVTYGTASAPYLANRVLKQLAQDYEQYYPAAASILREQTYVDDTLFGADTQGEIQEQRSQIVQLLKHGGFRLRKWASNYDELCREINNDTSAKEAHELQTDEKIKILGIEWRPREDAFFFNIVQSNPTAHPTKRLILAFIARMFDPLGWVAPVVVYAKIFMQELWLHKLDWDSPIPVELAHKWSQYLESLHYLQTFGIPRWVGHGADAVSIELHGFADASSRAYAAVIYSRITTRDNSVQVHLLIAKTRVAPLKTLSIPKLELSGALLLARLLKFVGEQLKLTHVAMFGWTDSVVVLEWIRQHPSKWNVFVANRVSEIQTLVPRVRWGHVSTHDNPADCASRGLSAAEFVEHALWKRGPAWLPLHSTMWPRSRNATATTAECEDILAEERKVVMVGTSPRSTRPTDHPDEWDLPENISSWPRLLRVTAHLKRFISNLHARRQGQAINTTALTAAEIDSARIFWLRTVQESTLGREKRLLQSGAPVARASALYKLHPFLGDAELIRVGGRLAHSGLSYSERHPIVLTAHRITHLIIAQAHARALHGGTQLTLRVLRQQYWVTKARSKVKQHISQCVRCVRERAQTASQLMAALPATRVSPAPPFTRTGVDYAGPFQVLPYVGRGQRPRKSYIALFICMTTKAVHLELVEDYSSNAFMAAFRRFASRRGLPAVVMSDNGTNFHGAERELALMIRARAKEKDFVAELASESVEWHFIPPASPHFGGLWEVHVKSVKHHLKRVIGSHTLSQAEFTTLLHQVEACLNSRPIAPLTDDPEDTCVLTPGHFLIGRPLVSLPEPDPGDGDYNRLSRWTRVQAMLRHIWRAWTRDYLCTLQQRSKWCQPAQQLRVHELVLLKNNNLPPSKWELARVEKVYPGKDGFIRVADVKTARATFKRPITQMCRLPENVNRAVNNK